MGWTLNSKWVVRRVSRTPGGWYIVVGGKRISFATAHVYQAVKRPVGADGRFWYRNWLLYSESLLIRLGFCGWLRISYSQIVFQSTVR